MIQENEIIMCVLGLGILTYTLVNKSLFKRIPSSKILLVAFCTVAVGWVLTVLEGFFWYSILNFIEHMCYAASSILTVIWCWKVFPGAKEAE